MSSDPDVLRADHLCGPYYGLPPIPTGLRQSLLATSGTETTHGRFTGCSRELEPEQQSVNALLNADALINRLPPELLGEIFFHLHSRNVVTWTTILTVCRHWFVVAATTPRIWCYLFVGNYTNFLRTGLARSKSCSFSLMVEPEASLDTWRALLDILDPHTHRLRELDTGANARSDVSLIAPYLRRHAMPKLEKIRITVVEPYSDRLSDNLFYFPSVRYPRLTSLSLFSTIIPPSSSIIRQLTSLELREPQCEQDPYLTCDIIVTILRNCVNIKSLNIASVVTYDEDDAPLPAEERIVLTKLQDLFIGVYNSLLSHILHAVAIPSTCMSAVIWPLDDEVEEHQGIRDVLEEHRSSLPILSRIETVTARISIIEDCPDRYMLTGMAGPCTADAACEDRPSSRDIELRMPLSELEEERPSGSIVSDDLVNIFRGSPLEDLFIDVGDAWNRDIDWHKIFSSFPTLRTFTLHGVGELSTILSIFAALQPDDAPEEPDGTTDDKRLVCAKLREMFFDGITPSLCPVDLDAVTDCLRRRAACLGSTKALDKLTFGFEQDSEMMVALWEAVKPVVLTPQLGVWVRVQEDD